MDWLENHFGAVFLIWIVVALSFWGIIGFVAYHFISKVW